ncbi:MAG: cytochrome c1 [Pseudomonadota bacterium]|nr:cytochrome c1 [Pseudomonadota bacterium]
MAKFGIKTLLASVLVAGTMGGAAMAAGKVEAPKDVDWHHEGPFGTYDRAQLQRGYQVYKEVCASCHSMHFVAFRNLLDIGFTEDQAKAIAGEFTVTDGPDSNGDMFDRPAILSDRFPSPFANKNAAMASNGGAYPPDLSLLAKARVGGEDYIYSLLSGYVAEGGHSEHPCPEGTHANPYFPGGCLKMPLPISEGQVEYVDGTEATVDQMSMDVAAFMTWAAEPKMEERKRMGLKVIIFLLVTCGLLYAAKKRIWSDLH